MESTELIKSGLNAITSLIEYLAKDAVGANFLNQYLLNRKEQSQALLEQQNTLNALVKSTADMENDTKDIEKRASSNNEHLEMILTSISALKNSVEKIENDHKKYVEQFKELADQTKLITNLIDDIQQISEQTKLLSFNASIEAAHAGAAGAGFRIIANEVKQLSAQTKETSDKILQNVNNLQVSISQIEEDTKRNEKNLSTLTSEADSTVEKFKEVRTLNGANNSNVEKISMRIAQNVQDMSKIIKNIQISQDKDKESLSLFADGASKNQMLFNDLYSFAYEIKDIFEDLR